MCQRYFIYYPLNYLQFSFSLICSLEELCYCEFKGVKNGCDIPNQSSGKNGIECGSITEMVGKAKVGRDMWCGSNECCTSSNRHELDTWVNKGNKTTLCEQGKCVF